MIGTMIANSTRLCPAFRRFALIAPLVRRLVMVIA
jgi:hypothetical protein